MQFASTGRSKCSRSKGTLRLWYPRGESPSFPLPCRHNGNADQDQRGIHLPRSPNFWALKKKRKKHAAERVEAAKDKKSLLHSPIRIASDDVTKSKISLQLRMKGSAEAQREEEMPGPLSFSLSLPLSLPPSLSLSLCHSAAVRSQKCSRFNLFKADPIFPPSLARAASELERGVRGRTGSKMRYRGRLISLLSARRPKLEKWNIISRSG